MAGNKHRRREAEPAAGPFDYEARAEEVRRTSAALREAAEQMRSGVRRDRERYEATRARLIQALDDAYPSGLWEAARRLPVGDLSALPEVIAFLEADPYFYSSGYAKAYLLRLLKQAPALPEPYAARSRGVLLTHVDARTRRREFRELCRLAPHVATPEFVEALRDRLDPLKYSYVTAGKAERMLRLLDSSKAASD